MWGRALLAALVAAGVLVPAAGVGGQACEQPYPPVYAQRGYPFNDPAPVLGQVEGVWRPAPPFPRTVDLDGDGTSDVTQFGPSANLEPPPTVHRPAGDITFARAGVNLQVLEAGDLDGDPGQEMWVMVLADFFSGGSFVDEAYVVPYGAPAGTHDPADVGIRVEPGLVFPVSDRTGDAVPDVFAVDSPSFGVGGTTRVLSGAAIIAAGVGGDARAAATLETIPGAALAIAFLGPVEAILTVQDLGGPDFEVRVVNGPVTTVLTNRPEVVGFSAAELRPGGIAVYAGPDGRFVSASASSRSGGGTYWWSLDDPCSPLGRDPLPPSRPAAPVAGTPRYTG